MHYTLKIETTVHQNGEGRDFLRFTPVASLPGYASGELRLACFEAWLDVPEEIPAQRTAARMQAVHTLMHCTVH